MENAFFLSPSSSNVHKYILCVATHLTRTEINNGQTHQQKNRAHTTIIIAKCERVAGVGIGIKYEIIKFSIVFRFWVHFSWKSGYHPGVLLQVLPTLLSTAYCMHLWTKCRCIRGGNRAAISKVLYVGEARSNILSQCEYPGTQTHTDTKHYYQKDDGKVHTIRFSIARRRSAFFFSCCFRVLCFSIGPNLLFCHWNMFECVRRWGLCDYSNRDQFTAAYRHIGFQQICEMKSCKNAVEEPWVPVAVAALN